MSTVNMDKNLDYATQERVRSNRCKSRQHERMSLSYVYCFTTSLRTINTICHNTLTTDIALSDAATAQ